MTAPASGVKVRMYRQGLGDCFLLAFATGGARPFYMLIDCGVLVGTEDAEEQMRQVAESLREATGGRIDVLVATHQHWDHLSGFEQAREVFDQIDIGEVWVAWTEDPENDLANRLRARRDTAVRALGAAARSLRDAGRRRSARSLEAVLGFFGELGADGRPSGLSGRSSMCSAAASRRATGSRRAAVGLPGVAGARLRARAAAGRGAAAAQRTPRSGRARSTSGGSRSTRRPPSTPPSLAAAGGPPAEPRGTASCGT